MAMARRWVVPPGAQLLRFPSLATATVPAPLRRGMFRGVAAGVASKSWNIMCVKADYTSPVDSMTSTEQTGDEIQEPAIVAPTNEETSTKQTGDKIQEPAVVAPANEETSMEQTGDEIQEPAIMVPANEETSTEQKVVPQQKCAKIHDFCLGIPFGGFLFSMGLIGFLFWRSPVSLTFGVAPGLAILALGVLSLKVWRSGKPSFPFILAQAVLAAAVAWKHSQAYITTKRLLPWGFYAALSAAMVCFYSYVLLAGGNPPPKKAATA